MTYLLVTISRTYLHRREGRVTLRRVLVDAHSRHPDAVLLHGDHPSGDRDAARIWEELGGTTEAHPADWTGPCRSKCKPGHRKSNPSGSTYCPAAGPYRNTDMVELKPVECHVFPTPESKGATGTAVLARAAGIPVFEHPQEES